MTTKRTLTARTPGPVYLDVSTGAFNVVVFTGDREFGEVTVSTADDAGPSAEAVNAATLDADGARLTARFPKSAGGVTIVGGGGHVQIGNGNVQVNSFGGVTVSGSNYGVISTGRGVYVNGQLVTGGAAVSPVQIVAQLPHGSSVRFESQSGDLRVSGRLRQATANSQSGDVDLDEVATVNADTMSGDISIGMLTGHADLHSMSGDISVHGSKPAHASARTMSGDVRGTGGLLLAGSSMSGRVRNR